MKRTILIIIGIVTIMLLSIIGIAEISKEYSISETKEILSFSKVDFKDYMDNEVLDEVYNISETPKYKTVTDNDDKRIYFYYNQTVYENDKDTFVKKDIELRAVVPFEAFDNCQTQYNESECYTILVDGEGYIFNNTKTTKTSKQVTNPQNKTETVTESKTIWDVRKYESVKNQIQNQIEVKSNFVKSQRDFTESSIKTELSKDSKITQMDLQ